MIGRIQSVPRRRRILTARQALIPLLALILAGLAVVPAAQAARAPTKSEAKAIKKSFLNGREVKTTIRRIRVSTVNTRFASITYSIADEEPATRTLDPRGGSKFPAPVPAIEKKAKGKKWKTVPKAPEKVKKDLKVKDPKSNIQVSGDYNALLTRRASCSGEDGGAGIYDPGSDTYLSVQFTGTPSAPAWQGPGWYGAYGVRSVAGIYGNQGQDLLYETGQPNDAFAASGRIYADYGWGLIFADMSPPPPTDRPNSVRVDGEWVCG